MRQFALDVLMSASLNSDVEAHIFGNIYAQTPAVENAAYK